MNKYKITFIPDNISIEVEEGRDILSASISAGAHISSVCGGDGACGKCKVIIKEGAVDSSACGGFLTADEYDKNVRLACKSKICSEVVIEIPPESRQDFNAAKEYHAPVFDAITAGETKSARVWPLSPLVTKRYLDIPAPTLDDKVSDVERLTRELRRGSSLQNVQVPLPVARNLSAFLRESDWKVTFNLAHTRNSIEILSIEKGDNSRNNCGLAVDIGTTTLNVQLIDLNSGSVLGTKLTYNRQALFGADVITRIIHAQKPAGLLQLYSVLVKDLNILVRSLATDNSVDLNNITAVVCAGNTAMTHILLRIDPTYIRREPYVPTLNFIPLVNAREAGFEINPKAKLFCAPSVAGYVGGDITAGVLSTGIHKKDSPCLLIDIGTNGEVVLGDKDFLLSCAASAGPAFEGSGVSSGMRAVKGAIEKFSIADKHDFQYAVIGGSLPAGICGSGYISLIGEMLKAGLIDKNGRFFDSQPCLINEDRFGKQLLLVKAEKTRGKKDIFITEPDIDNLKRAKAAIFSAIATLLASVRFSLDNIDKVFIAGGFGSCIDIKNAIRIGLLPPLKEEKFIFVGNSSLNGARAMLNSEEARAEVEEIAGKTTYLELSTDAAYMNEYIAALFFPHTDVNKFPVF